MHLNRTISIVTVNINGLNTSLHNKDYWTGLKSWAQLNANYKIFSNLYTCEIQRNWQVKSKRV